MSICSSN